MFDAEIEVPNSWVWTAIREVAESMQNGIYKPTQFYSDDGVACLRMYNIENGSIVWKDIKRMNLSQEEIQNYELKPGDILVNRVNSRELVGKAAPITLGLEICIYESKNIRLRLFKNFIESKFIGFWFRIYSQKYFTKNAQQTVGMASINQEQLGLMPLPLPPLNEQRRIVAKIEALKARSQKAKEALEAIPALLDQFRQSVLAAAFRGDLTADWREKNPDIEPASVLLERIRTERRCRWEEAELEKMKAQGKTPKDDKWKEKYKEPDLIDNSALLELPNEWCWVAVELLSTKVVDGVHKKPNYVETGIPFVTIKNLTAGPGINFDELNYISPEDHKEFSKRADPELGDILITKDGTLGVVRTYPTNIKFELEST